VALFAFVTYHRQNSSQHSGLLYTYFPSLPRPSYIIGQASRLMQVVAFGGVVYSTLECGYSALTLVVYLLTHLLRKITPSKSFATFPWSLVRPDPFRPEAWPRLSNKPLKSNSLADFWGKRWHALFRRIFIVVGSKPLAVLVQYIPVLEKSQKKVLKLAAGTLGAFMTSGILHECCESTFPAHIVLYGFH
jgi:hypothetical protein